MGAWVIGCGWAGRMRRALPGLQQWLFPMTLLLSWNGFRCFSSICIPPFWNYFPSTNIAPTHSPPPIKELSPDSHLKSLAKNIQKCRSCLTKHVYCETERHESLLQAMSFAYLSTALCPKSSKGLSLSICVWSETSLYVKSILWQSFIGMVLGGKTKQDGVWIELCVLGPFKGSHSWLETCTCSAQGCASAHVCVSWAPLLNPVNSSAHVSCTSLGTAVYSSNK